ncbi:MAG TPA: DNA-3-methyladenine glycosylase [Candidatus Methylacidiphilales bacterium]|nr:DNA-3-methyladenine glycosylase [Candidatus Methylacidiphilales bacterium]
MRLPAAVFAQPDPVIAARYFLGKTLVVRDLDAADSAGTVPTNGMDISGTSTPGIISGGIITETEAYGGAEDKACHGYANRRTARTEIMFGPGGFAYVYLCYGIHWMINIVTGPAEVPMAVLIRAVQVTEGRDHAARRRRGLAEKHWASGPGKVTSALGITRRHNGADMRLGTDIWLEDRGHVVEDKDISVGPRVGVDYAGEWAHMPWHFVWRPPTPVSVATGIR